jgi:CHAD domain-containing protein
MGSRGHAEGERQLIAGEPLDAGVHRLAGRLLQRVERNLLAPADRRDAGIHEARKALKKARALLRLVRTGLGPAFDAENAALRDLGRMLASRRDAAATLTAFHKLTEESGEPAAERFPDVHAALTGDAVPAGRAGAAAEGSPVRLVAKPRRMGARASQGPAGSRGRGVAPELEQALEAARAAEARLGALAVHGGVAAVLAAGVEKAHSKARKAGRRAEREPVSPQFHEWRKHVKHLLYMAGFLGSIWKELSPVKIGALERLAELLGDEHDLWVLRTRVTARAPSIGAAEIAAFMELVDDKRTELQINALTSGLALLAKKPKRVRKRLAATWDEAAASG